MTTLTQQDKLELVARRIGVLKQDLDGIHTQSDEVIYLVEDIKARLDQLTNYSVAFVTDAAARVAGS